MNPTKAEGQLIQLDEARRTLAKIARVDEAKKIRDKAEAIRVYAKQQRMGLDAQNKAAEIKIRAERRAGELLAAIERKPGPGRGKKNTQAAGSFTSILQEEEIKPDSARRWQEIASIPEKKFEREMATIKDMEDVELTSALMQRVARGSSATDAVTQERSPGYVWEVNVGKMDRFISFFESQWGDKAIKAAQRKRFVDQRKRWIANLRSIK